EDPAIRDSGKVLGTSSASTSETLCELARQHMQAERTLDAQLCCEQALAADPHCADAMHLMGRLALRAEQVDHAIHWFTRAVEQEEKPRYLLDLGQAARQQGRFEDALRAFDRAAELDIASAEAWKPFAQLLADLGRRHEAAMAFQQVLKLDPGDADAT